MIKVLHVVIGLQVGGLERVVIDLINNYSLDIQSAVVCLEEGGELETSCSVEVYALHKQPGFSVTTVKKLYALLKELKIDLIHTHNPAPHFYGALAGFLAGIPVINTKHGRNYLNCLTEVRKIWLNRFSTLLSGKIVAVSQNAASVCLDVEKISPSKVLVILNGINTNVFCPVESHRDTDRVPVNIGIVSRLSAEKDHQTLLEACKLLVAEHANFHLDIIGDGPLRGNLEQLVRNLELDAYVSLLGMKHDIPTLLRELDIFALSSTTEGISLTLLEAMASGLPIVATDVGGNPEVVVDGTTGFIVPPQNPEALAQKLSLLINDRLLRKRMGEAGRIRVIDKFDIRRTARNYESLYHNVLGKAILAQ